MAYVKVSIKGKKPIYLEHAKHIVRGEFTFVSGYQVNKQGEGITNKKGGDIMHLIQVGEGVKVVAQTMDKFYGELENTKL